MSVSELVLKLSENFSKIIEIDDIKSNPSLYWGGNGVGDRWLNKKYNYCVIYSNKKIKIYSENDDKIPLNIFNNFDYNKKYKGILGIYVFSHRKNTIKHPINEKIKKEITSQSCVICGSNSDIVCDHKNDMYNDERVLNITTQKKEDFQPLCNHCNLQKRQIYKNEEKTNKLYSAKNILRYNNYRFEFPWEKKIFDKTDINCKKDTYWYDPVEFENKIFCYMSYVIPLILEIKKKVKIIS